MSSSNTEMAPPDNSDQTHKLGDSLEKLRANLLRLGYDRVKLDKFIKHGNTVTANDLLASSLPEQGKGSNQQYQSLRLYKATNEWNKNWVLFDPRKGFPDCISRYDLPHLLPFAVYRPEKQRYLEYNTVSSSVRNRFIRDVFAGKRVEYTTSGPVFVPLEIDSDSELSELTELESEAEDDGEDTAS